MKYGPGNLRTVHHETLIYIQSCPNIWYISSKSYLKTPNTSDSSACYFKKSLYMYIHTHTHTLIFQIWDFQTNDIYPHIR